MLRAEYLFDRLDVMGRRGRLFQWALLAVLTALPVLLLMPLFAAPFDRDQGTYGVVARGWLQGAIPYRDLWDNKGPILFLWFAAAFRLLGENVVAPRLLAALAAAAAVPFVWGSARGLLGRRAATLAAALFATSFANLFLQANANAEIFMLLPLAAGFWAFARGARGAGVWWFGVAGVLTAVAALTKQTAAWTLIGYGLWLAVLAQRNPKERRRHVTAGFVLAGGTALGLLPFGAYFFYYGALRDLLFAVFVFNMAFVAQFPWALKLVPPLLWHPLPLVGGAALWFLALVGAAYLWRRGDRLAWLILIFLIFSELAAQSVGKNAAHYNVQLLPAAALAGAVGLQVVVDRWRAGQHRLGQVALICVAVSVGASVLVYAQPAPEERFEAQYALEDLGTNYADRSIEAREIADRVATLTKPGDYIYEFGRESEIYFLADRRPASRWLHNRAYALDVGVLDEILQDLERNRPALILLTFQCGRSFQDFPGCEDGPPLKLEAYLDEHYVYAGRLHYANFYLRREEEPASSSPRGPGNP
jgi:4-amino-4-deoxy-L-arabinose transferase-like glycosyltransferase